MTEDNLVKELKLDGHIYLVEKDAEGTVVSQKELDGESCLKLLVAVLDDAVSNPYIQTIFSALEE